MLQRVGAGNTTAAKGTIRVAITICSVMMVLWLSILVPCRALLASLFFPKLQLHSGASRALMDCILLIAVGSPGDWINCTLSGVLQGTGRQGTGARIYVIAYWCFGPILLWLFAFRLDWGIRGIWLMLAILQNVLVLVMAVRNCCFPMPVCPRIHAAKLSMKVGVLSLLVRGIL